MSPPQCASHNSFGLLHWSAKLCAMHHFELEIRYSINGGPGLKQCFANSSPVRAGSGVQLHARPNAARAERSFDGKLCRPDCGQRPPGNRRMHEAADHASTLSSAGGNSGAPIFSLFVDTLNSVGSRGFEGNNLQECSGSSKRS